MPDWEMGPEPVAVSVLWSTVAVEDVVKAWPSEPVAVASVSRSVRAAVAETPITLGAVAETRTLRSVPPASEVA